jgi:hypothetical protein
MAYAEINFKTKKALKEAVKISNENAAQNTKVRAYQSGLGPDLSNYTGRVSLEGPHYPANHNWYATCEMKDGVIIKVS